jgi:hypothetical protein
MVCSCQTSFVQLLKRAAEPAGERLPSALRRIGRRGITTHRAIAHIIHGLIRTRDDRLQAVNRNVDVGLARKIGAVCHDLNAQVGAKSTTDLEVAADPDARGRIIHIEVDDIVTHEGAITRKTQEIIRRIGARTPANRTPMDGMTLMLGKASMMPCVPT